MVRRRTGWLLVVVAAAVGVFLWALRPSDAAKIRNTFRQLDGMLDDSTAESLLVKAGRAAEATRFLANPVTMEYPAYGLSGDYDREDMRRLLIKFWSWGKGSEVSFHDVNVVSLDGDQAEVVVTAQIEGRFGGDALNEVHELHCQMLRAGGEWLLAGCRVEQVFRR